MIRWTTATEIMTPVQWTCAISKRLDMTDTELLDGLYGEVGTWTDVIILTIEHTTWHHQHGTLELSLELTSSVYYVYTEVDCAMVMIHNKDSKLLHQIIITPLLDWNWILQSFTSQSINYQDMNHEYSLAAVWNFTGGRYDTWYLLIRNCLLQWMYQ